MVWDKYRVAHEFPSERQEGLQPGGKRHQAVSSDAGTAERLERLPARCALTPDQLLTMTLTFAMDKA